MEEKLFNVLMIHEGHGFVSTVHNICGSGGQNSMDISLQYRRWNKVKTGLIIRMEAFWVAAKGW